MIFEKFLNIFVEKDKSAKHRKHDLQQYAETQYYLNYIHRESENKI